MSFDPNSDDLPPMGNDAAADIGSDSDSSDSDQSDSESNQASSSSSSSHHHHHHHHHTKTTTSGRVVPVYNKLVKGKTDEGVKTINGRVVLHALGEGATADVSLCQDATTKEFFALKKMSKRALTKMREYGMGPLGRPKITTGLDKVQKEIEIMKLLDHVNILRLESVIDDPEEDALILVLEHASQGQIMQFDGESASYKKNIFTRHVAESSASSSSTATATDSTVPASAASAAAVESSGSAGEPIPESILRKLVVDVVNGLEYLHGLKIAHRDIKPENLLLSSSGIVKICDFGVARHFGSHESPLISETHGTYHFFSPEMTTGDRYSAFGQDIWALGLTCYILASGGLIPFHSSENNPAELFEKIGSFQPSQLEYPASIQPQPSDALKQFIAAILNPLPNQRLTLEQIRNHEWIKQNTSSTSSSSPLSPLQHDLEKLNMQQPKIVPATSPTSP